MDNPQKNPSLFSSLLAPLKEKLSASYLSVSEIMASFENERSTVAILFMSLPFCLPISIPGISLPFGLAIVWLGCKELFNVHLHLPSFIATYKIASPTIQKLIYLSTRLDHFLKPCIGRRWQFMSDTPIKKRAQSLIAVINGLLLCLPLPIPFSNWIPTAAIIVTFIGRLFDDGLLICTGYVITLGCLTGLSHLIYYLLCSFYF